MKYDLHQRDLLHYSIGGYVKGLYRAEGYVWGKGMYGGKGIYEGKGMYEGKGKGEGEGVVCYVRYRLRITNP